MLIEKLDTNTLLKFGYRILFYISQLDTFEEVARPFLQKITQKNTNSKAYKDIAAVLQYCFGVGSEIVADSMTVAEGKCFWLNLKILFSW